MDAGRGGRVPQRRPQGGALSGVADTAERQHGRSAHVARRVVEERLDAPPRVGRARGADRSQERGEHAWRSLLLEAARQKRHRALVLQKLQRQRRLARRAHLARREPRQVGHQHDRVVGLLRDSEHSTTSGI